MKRVCSLLMVLCVLFSVTVQAKVPESNGLIVVDSIESDVVKISTEDLGLSTKVCNLGFPIPA